jgi:hypothetical protein
MVCTSSPTRPALVAISVAPRFRGPAESVNGGYMCGRVAAYIDGPVTVTLRQPPPLDTPMTVETYAEDSVRVQHGGTLIAEAGPALNTPELVVPGHVTSAEARAAQGRSPYFQKPYFPGCFVCGIDRPPGDGLRIMVGQVPDRGVWAAPWTPDTSAAYGSGGVRPEIVWAALDCPSGIAAGEAFDLGPGGAIVLGRMTANVAALPEVGDECRLIAWPIARDGRKLTAGSALLGPDDRVLAVATAVWLTIARPVSERTGETS